MRRAIGWRTRGLGATATTVAAALLMAGCSVQQEQGDNAAAEPDGNAAITATDPKPADPDAAGPPATPIAVETHDPSLEWGPCPEIFPAGCELTVLQGDPAKPNADALLKVPGGYDFPAHSHSSAERMILISGTLDVHYQGAKPTTLTAGTYAYGPAGLPHVARCASAGPCLLFIAFEGPVDVQPFEGEIGGGESADKPL